MSQVSISIRLESKAGSSLEINGNSGRTVKLGAIYSPYDGIFKRIECKSVYPRPPYILLPSGSEQHEVLLFGSIQK